MRLIVLFFSVFLCGLHANAQERRFRTIQELKAAGRIQMTCKTAATNPETNVSFRYGFGAPPDSLALAVIWPEGGMWVGEVKTDATYPVWAREYLPGEVVSFVGNSVPTHETATVKIEQGSGGRFKMTMTYIHRVTGEQVNISDLRCYATNYARALGQ